MKHCIYDLTLPELTAWLVANGEKKSRASQIWGWLYRKRITEFNEMLDVNQACRELLAEHFVVQTLAEEVRQVSADGTIKFLFRLQDENLIETVLMNTKFGVSVCVTTQVGCNMGCSFCASGLLKKHRDLSSGEIVQQIIKAQAYLDEHDKVVTHVVIMGIGEPFDNFQNLIKFLEIIKDYKGLAIGATHITVSTCGLADKIYEFTDANQGVNLAISLHAPSNELRSRLMKVNHAYPLEELFKAINYYIEKTNRRRVTLEYILLKDVNDSPQHARELADLIGENEERLTVNLIPYNPVDEHSQYERCERETARAFYDILKKRGINCSIRLEQGADIDAACGQLRSKQIKE
ncbi:MAG: 23S rRNA (adenine(2503)-C(2))-methyltransferase RlmN [Pelosinus sp.]|nr:23S rRNA (adenine(2503)-C(2))-methyltransferase RlmN [Pelosinus sp.]